MQRNSLDMFTDAVSSAWPAGGRNLIDGTRIALAGLSAADPADPWLAELLAEMPATRELHRDPAFGFMLLAHAESEGLYRPPHDHGRAWVVYAVQSGALEVRTYKRLIGPAGDVTIVERDCGVLLPGEARVYLPGEIHDTRCLTETALVLRFTERDLRHEDLQEGRVTRFVMNGDRWAAARR